MRKIQTDNILQSIYFLTFFDYRLAMTITIEKNLPRASIDRSTMERILQLNSSIYHGMDLMDILLLNICTCILKLPDI